MNQAIKRRLTGTRAALVLALCAMFAFPVAASAMDTSYHTPVGPFQTINYSGTQLGLASGHALAGNATATGAAIVSNGIRNVAVSCTSSHAFTATLTTYLDSACTVVDEAVSDTGTTGQAKVLRTTANYPFQSFQVKILDTSGVAGTCSASGVGQN